MWLKVLKVVVIVGKTLGLDKKVGGWVIDRLDNIDKRIKDVDDELRTVYDTRREEDG